jgi:hypothetical protein
MGNCASSLDMAARGEDDPLGLELKKALGRAIRARGIRREEIAKELTARLGRAISIAMLDTWTSQGKFDWHIPADAVPALAEILQDDSLRRYSLNPAEREALELGESARKLDLLLKKASERASKLARNRTAKRRRK